MSTAAYEARQLAGVAALIAIAWQQHAAEADALTEEIPVTPPPPR